MDDDEIPDLIDVRDHSTETGNKQGSRPLKKVPITIVTGYLGAGKTTLLNYILTAEHGKKIAVMLNEFGNTADIEKSLTVNQNSQSSTEWIPLANGCICCSIKDSGVAALEALVERQQDFDYIILETTGVADPGNIAPMFWLDEGLGSSIYLDGIVTVVDAKNILKSLDEPTPDEIPESEPQGDHDHDGSQLMTTAHLQISHADVLILNKTDLVTEEQLSIVKRRITSINSLAHLIPTTKSHVPNLSGTVLDLQAYSTFPSTGTGTGTDPRTSNGPDFASKGHSHLDPTISTITLPLPPFDLQKLPMLENWLETILWDMDERQEGQDRKYEVHRTKGLVPLMDGTLRIVQGVREVFEIIEPPKSEQGDSGPVPTEGKIVFIGRNLDLIEKMSGMGVTG